MDTYIKYWNSVEKRLEVKCYETDFMRHTTAKDLQHSFNEKLESFSASNHYKLEWIVLT